MRRFIAVCTLAAAAFAASRDASAAPLKCVSNDVNAGPAVVSDSVLTTDPVQKGHLYVAGAAAPAAASTCAAPKAAPAVADPTMDFHYKAHVFKNRSTTASCVSVRYTFTAAAQGTGFHEVTAYLGSFDPNDVTKNYLGDSGRNDAGPAADAYSITVPPMSDFVLVTTWAGPATPGYEPTYSLYVAGCGQMVLTGIAPAQGPELGGTNVVLQGSGFEGTTPLSVAIGAAAMANVVVVDDSTVTATTAPNAAGTYDVTATGATGATSTLPAAFTYGNAPSDAGADADADDGGDAGDAGSDASTHGPTTGGPTQGSPTGDADAGASADAGSSDEADDETSVDGGTDGAAKPISVAKPSKKKSSGDEEYVCACNEIGRSSTPGAGAFATMAIAALAVVRLRKRR